MEPLRWNCSSRLTSSFRSCGFTNRAGRIVGYGRPERVGCILEHVDEFADGKDVVPQGLKLVGRLIPTFLDRGLESLDGGGFVLANGVLRNSISERGFAGLQRVAIVAAKFFEGLHGPSHLVTLHLN